MMGDFAFSQLQEHFDRLFRPGSKMAAEVGGTSSRDRCYMLLLWPCYG